MTDAGSRLAIVGIGADGPPSLSRKAIDLIAQADSVVGSRRQLDLVAEVRRGVEILLPSPVFPALVDLLGARRGERTVVLASGDPMFYGIGGTLARYAEANAPEATAFEVVPAASSMSLAAARLGWALEDVDVISAVGRPLSRVNPLITPGRRILALTSSPTAAADVRQLLARRRYSTSTVTVLSSLGAAEESVEPATGLEHDPLSILAIECRPDADAALLSRSAALPDSAYDHDGQITKQEVRAITLSALTPVPEQLLWDVGAGSGSVGIEWMRTHPSCTAIAIEPRAERAERIESNAIALGVPGLRVVRGAAPGALADLPAPDAVFVGGAVSRAGVIDACVEALGRGGRLVANAVTVQSETALAQWHERIGGTLTRVMVQRAAPVGGFTGWRPAMPITQWSWRKIGP